MTRSVNGLPGLTATQSSTRNRLARSLPLRKHRYLARKALSEIGFTESLIGLCIFWPCRFTVLSSHVSVAAMANGFYLSLSAAVYTSTGPEIMRGHVRYVPVTSVLAPPELPVSASCNTMISDEVFQFNGDMPRWPEPAKLGSF